MKAGDTRIAAGFVCIVALWVSGSACGGQRRIELATTAGSVGRYERLEMVVRVDERYGNPFDPEEVDLAVRLACPGGESLTVPAFYCQEYERRQLGQGPKKKNWCYPRGDGGWRARFAPMETGTYEAVARLKDRKGTIESESVRFECVASAGKGFLRAGREDARFFEFDDGGYFFAIGQNLAFIGEGQYVNLSRAEDIFAKLAANGANFLRIWTCCEDWAMALEAKKSAWERSWGRKATIVAAPGEGGRRCVQIEGGGGSVEVSPSHPVGLRPGVRYVLQGRFMADGPSGLRVEISGGGAESFEAGGKGRWKEFRHEFASGGDDLWLGRTVLRAEGAGKAWIDGLSLKEAGGGAELLWEANVNRRTRGYYNQVDCFMLDKLVEAAEKNGIYLMLCVITRDLYMKSLSDDESEEYTQAVEDAKKLMRYAVARWGYSTHVAAWEYFNEIDPGLPTERFYDEVGGYLEEVDVYRHLRATSTWHPSAKDCRHKRLDIGQLHHYMRPVANEDYKDEAAVITERARWLREHGAGKPVLIGEFGLADAKWGLSDSMKDDTGAVHFHNSLWASAFSGVSGTAMFWWWEQLDMQDAYGEYKGLSDFLAGVSFSGLRAAEATPSEGVRAVGYQGEESAYLWISNPEATWWNIVAQKQEPRMIEGGEVNIRGLETGAYSVEWWDTHAGRVEKRVTVSASADGLQLSIPAFSRDIGVKIRR